jgi:hypothetical protein
VIRWSLLMVAIVIVAGCVGTGSGANDPSTIGANNASVACPVTAPTETFVAPAPAPERPPESYQAEWYGTRSLWTMLDRDGEVWASLPEGPDGFGQKTFWWSVEWDSDAEPQPEISVTGRRLDAPGQFKSEGRGTNAFADFGAAMLVGVTIPTTGCWELTGTYRGESLSYVVQVAD